MEKEEIKTQFAEETRLISIQKVETYMTNKYTKNAETASEAKCQ